VIQQYDEESVSMHGIPATEEAFEHLISAESPYRYELIDGIIYDMTGSTPEHSAITENQEHEWKLELFTQGQTIQIDQLDLEFPLASIYEGVL
jgi:hypothetical protein